MKKVTFLAGVLWASPITLLAFMLYIIPMWVLRWYKFVGFHEQAWVWKLDEESPEWLHKLWDGWAGHTIGNIIVLVEAPCISRYADLILNHELQHVRQHMRLGPLFPIVYVFFSLFMFLGCPNSSISRGDHPFDIDAQNGIDQYRSILRPRK